MSRVICPARCGSTAFKAVRQGSITEEFEVDADTGDITTGASFGQGGGNLTLSCSECGHTWRTRRWLDLATYVEGGR